MLSYRYRYYLTHPHEFVWEILFGSLRWLTRGVTNLVVWFPVVWRDDDINHYDLLAVMRFKINRMYKSRQHPRSIERPDEGMRRAGLVLDRLMSDLHDKMFFWPSIEGKRNALKRYKARKAQGKRVYEWDDILIGLPVGKNRFFSHRCLDILRQEKSIRQDISYLCRLLDRHMINW